MADKQIALIPAYKPSNILTDLVRELSENGFLIVIVDDGSGQEYQTILEQCKSSAQVLHHTENAGKGTALKTGLTFIRQTFGNDCVVVTVDADGQHLVQDAVSVMQKAEQNPAALVIGSRTFIGTVPARSRFGNSVTRFVYQLISGVRLQDTQTGLRAFHGGLIPILLEIPGSRYEYEMNVLLAFAKRHVPILEHEIETIYENQNASSHFKPIRDSVRVYAQILKFSASSLIGFLIDYLLYTVLLLLTDYLTFSNIGARLVSASVNFMINRTIVFQSKEKVWKSALKYIALAMLILAGNTALLHFFVTVCSIHQLLAKVITELTCSILSWLIQKYFVFTRR